MAAAVERASAGDEAASGGPTIKVTFYNDCHGYQGVMYSNDWRQKGHKVSGSGKFLEVPFDGTLPCPLRITFAATLGAYLKCGENDML